ncbi:dipeptidyl carboxypeptidase II [Phenylobacterium hankyongense]|uniref:Dipeptidyl carboxypeptidase n=1 Tax=Phenylobacterium hankyongense TaxID=1813876 RepID=A0A328B081_9CAUL|nr:M3 family metallopeptidase [Phenylobacterium hankyongense]RAK60792.1 dipeptidyl carboxypeptidase II [Phenylobacterium hankyongense]
MHRLQLLLLSVATTALTVGATAEAAPRAPAKSRPAAAAAAAPGSVFAEPSPLFLHAPQWDKIKDSDFQPGLEAGMARQKAEIAAIADNPAPPTFENTIVAMERSGQMLDRANSAFSALTGANTNDTLQKIETEESPRLTAHRDAIYLNPKLFQRVRSLYDRRAGLKLDPEAQQLLEVTYRQFVHAGANLAEADKTRLKALNAQISSLETAFQQKLLAGAKAGAVVIDNKAKLQGLSDAQIAAAAAAAEARGLKGKWVIVLQNTTQQPLLQDLADRGVREQLYNSAWTRTERGDANDTRETLATIARLRAEKAKLLGFPNFAAYVLEDQMAKTPQAAEDFMHQLSPAARARSTAEAADIQKVIDQGGEHFQVKPWDWNRYSERVRKARYDLNEEEIKPYFELDRVLRDGVFYAANQLYGITFKERKDLPVYHPDVRVFEVHDKDGSVLGLAYFDYFKRDNKAGGAWMSNFVGQSKLLGTKPVIYNVANLTKPAPGQPALISFDDVTTMFHEFGHGLHGLFAAQEYPTLSGTNVARDFVEFPSQFNENWALDPKVLPHYAVHYKTGQPIPQPLVDKIKKASSFNQGYGMGELIAAAELDMQWHALGADAPKADVDAFEVQALKAGGADFPDVPPRYRSSYFLHIWSNGYAAGYYAYLWTQMLADDSFSWFKDNGGLTRANGQRFRDLVLSKGHTLDYGPMFRAFYGKDPDIGPMLQHRGLAGGDK